MELALWIETRGCAMIPGMDLEAARKAISKRGALSSKRIAFFVVAGLALAVGIVLRSGQYFGQPDVEQNAPVTLAAPTPPAPATPAVEATESVATTPTPAQEPATAPDKQAEQPGEVVEQAKPTDEAVLQAPQTESPDAGMILVSRRPVEVRASPSSSAPTTFGFPAGRSFRVIGHDGGFAQIQDVRSGASGWIDEASLTPPPRGPAISAPSRAPTVTAPSQPKPVAVGGKSANPSTAAKPKAANKDSQVAGGSAGATEPDPVQPEKRPGLLGGVFKGIFGGGNGN